MMRWPTRPAVAAAPRKSLGTVSGKSRKLTCCINVGPRVQAQQSLAFILVEARSDPAAVRPEDERGVDVAELRRDVEWVRAQHQEA